MADTHSRATWRGKETALRAFGTQLTPVRPHAWPQPAAAAHRLAGGWRRRLCRARRWQGRGRGRRDHQRGRVIFSRLDRSTACLPHLQLQLVASPPAHLAFGSATMYNSNAFISHYCRNNTGLKCRRTRTQNIGIYFWPGMGSGRAVAGPPPGMGMGVGTKLKAMPAGGGGTATAGAGATLGLGKGRAPGGTCMPMAGGVGRTKLVHWGGP